MDTQDQTKKCFCARCFLPIEAHQKVDVEGQNFHRICSMCCICRKIPTSLKMFSGHVFCNECFKNVMTRFRGDHPMATSNSWWTHIGPDFNQQNKKDNMESKPAQSSSDSTKRCICARCLQLVDDDNKVNIENQSFHPQCAKCCVCQVIPKTNVKIYYGQVFCQDCFQRHVLNKNQDNPSEFFRQLFQQWQNPQFTEYMNDFMGSRDCSPCIFMMQGPQPPFCKGGTGPQSPDWPQANEAKKSASVVSFGEDFFSDKLFENRIQAFGTPESSDIKSAIIEKMDADAAEKIAKLTKLLHVKCTKKWKNFNECPNNVSGRISQYAWMDLQDSKVYPCQLECPKCLWQCGPIYVDSDYYLKKKMIENFE